MSSIDERLRIASALSGAVSSTTPRVPMTRDAIDLRLRQVSELSHACLRLARLGEGLASAREQKRDGGERKE